ncbi:lamin tail domain-containing protein [Actinoplanes missouriensis]|uniref:lamin tail domain-containing protein n=1 Tax=Actinoplanes missouriensis TaxID=1866 RepID=UPI00340313D6
MRRLLGTVAAFAAVLGGTLAVASPAQAAPALRFHSAQYDSPGKDTRSNKSRNAEWIALVNTGKKAVNLKGWSIKEKGGRVYTFGSVSIPAKGGKIYLHTGKGTNTKTHVYWNSGNYIWNNTGDKATLRKPDKKTQDTCSWGNKKGRTKIAC